MPLSHIANGFFFALWVSVCSAAPEFLWQGLLSLCDHFTLLTAASALLVGSILAFFVEPVLEYFRSLSFQSVHADKSPAFAACTALAFAVVAVCVHEAITVYVDASPANQRADESLVRAVSQVIQWAAVPFAITTAWLAARSNSWISWPLAILPLLITYVTGRGFGWSSRDIITTAIPCTLILTGGYICVRQQWDHLTFRRCAFVTTGIALAWLALAGALQLGLWLSNVRAFSVYDWTDYGIDFRFYFGWVVGLCVAPPLLQSQRGRAETDVP
ncbi:MULTISPECIES: hypothetical protein [Paraburkholderia]|uniref:hypothetical protein n=1 Tax=Paraburkholderia TaxID=1822464 RepID=UPI002258DDD4|nr:MULTISPECIES: hypothetical protein [Paraburkholderia]MCX4159651.1 hypothetical protein [Paraburkholderia aspalathi]MDN7169049.1 hypothetical protein [Paraburkholderia sp. SECH2]MDQ6397536.1 hypothetical protein [Paraburkholderia aspalathi]